MDPKDVFLRLGIAVALGFLVGLQRQSEGNRLAGIRTFPMIAALGALCGLLVPTAGGWALAAGFLSVATMLGLMTLRMPNQADDQGRVHPGLTTLVAGLTMFAVGAYLMVGLIAVGVVVGGGLAVLLHAKQSLHSWVTRLGAEDLRAVFRFALISLVILPVLPNTALDRWGAVTPREVWLMVVLIVGIGLGGYVLLKVFGEKAGTVLGGVLGGIVSSTATTVSVSRRSREVPGLANLGALVVMIASTVALLRLLAFWAVVDPGHLGTVALPLCAFCGIMAGITLAAWFTVRRVAIARNEHVNPAELRPALIFAGLYALISLAVAACKDQFGEGVLYPVAAVSGMTDLDAITLSSARMSSAGGLRPEIAWKLIVVAALANLVFKGGAVWFLGTRSMAIRVTVLFGLSGLGGALVLLVF